MLFIRTLSDGVIFSSNESIVVYDEEYPADYFGKKLDANDESVASGNYYEYGDIIFESSSMKVIFSRVYCSYSWIAEILDYIQAHMTDEAIVLDLNALMKNGDDYAEFECGPVIVEKFGEVKNL